VDEINAAGGLLGREVKLETFDIQDLAPERVAMSADTLVAQKKCDAVFAGWAGFGGDVQAYGRYPVPFFHGDAQQASVDAMKDGGYQNIWMTLDTEANVGADQWAFASSLDYAWPNKKVAFIHSEDGWASAVYKAIGSAAKADGWTVVSEDKVPYGTTQWGAIMAKIRSEEPALIMFDMMSAADMLSFTKEFQKQPIDAVVDLGMGMSIREFQEGAQGKIDGYIGSTNLACGFTIPPASTEQQAWYDAFVQKYGAPPGGLAGTTYTGVKAWAAAVEATGDPSGYEAVNAWMASNPFTVWDGVPDFKFDADHCIRDADAPLGFGQMHGDEMKTLWYGAPDYTDFHGNTYEFQVPSWIK